MAKRSSKEYFIKRAQGIHGDTYDYSHAEYTNLETKVLIQCPKHDITFEQSPRVHLIQKHGCPQCGIEKRNENNKIPLDVFIARAKDVHGEKYDYSLVEYVNTMNKVRILCKEHGVFDQTPNNHISKKQGCPHCFNARRGEYSVGGYTTSLFENFPEVGKIPATLYLIRMINHSPPFVKVGITKRTVHERFQCEPNIRMKDWELITESKLPLKKAFELEQKVIATLHTQRFFPNKRFGGFTECLKDTAENINIIMSIMNEYI